MSLESLQRGITQLDRAATQLEEALSTPTPTPLEIDGTIQRFEFTFELTWKALRRVLAWEGLETRSPRAAIKAAYADGLLDDETQWLTMLADRNLTSHVYDETAARAIHLRIRDYAPAIRQVVAAMRERIPSA